jgi:hypothetical protein
MSESGEAMDRSNRVEAVHLVRKLRGGSQPFLIKASDGLLYVVKFHDNPQGPNLLFNEAVGTELFREAGLRVPEWRVVRVSEDFIQAHSECWLQTSLGAVRPSAGECFGSSFLGLIGEAVFEILAGGHFSRLRDRGHFWTAWILDVFCDHTDNRQVVFVEGAARWLEAYFIDHGHMFGGAYGTKSSHFRASQYLDPRIYTQATAELASELEERIHSIDLRAVAETVFDLPNRWASATAMTRFQSFVQRISNRTLVKNVIRCILGVTETAGMKSGLQPEQPAGVCQCSSMRPQIPLSRIADRICGRKDDPASGQGYESPQALHASLLKAVNF